MSPDLAGRVRGDPARTSDQERAEDEALRREVRTARAWGVPYSTFCGHGAVTTFEHNAAGRVVRAVTVSPWTAEDRELAIALDDYEADLCPGCGRPLADTTKPEDEFAYRAGLPVRCHRCTASALASERFRDHPQPEALLIPLEHIHT